MSKILVENLFRRQAIESLTENRPGRPICAAPRPWKWLSLLVILIFATTAYFLGAAEYSRKESVRGWLVSKNGVVRISNTTSAIINDVTREAGDKVLKGEPLIYLSSDPTLSDGTAISVEMLAQLQLEESEIETQLNLSQQQRELESASLTQQLHELDGEIGALRAAQNGQRQRIVRGTEKLQRVRHVAGTGAVSDWDVIQQQDESGLLQLELDALLQDLARLQREREVLKSRFDNLPLQTGMRQSAMRTRRSQLAQQMAEHEVRRLSVLESPRSGFVASVEVHVGAPIRPGQTLMTVLPEEMNLAAELYVPSRAAGFIHVGQKVRISYDAFPQQKFGTFGGRVQRVSDYVFLPSEIPQTFPIQEATYKVHVTVGSSNVNTSVGPAALRPGMLLGAEIILEKRNLLDWLLEPLRLRRSTDS